MKILIWIVVLSFCFIQSGETTNKFLRTLLTTTPSASHISDFRQQRRTDSRADKPDTFPGFDLEEITLSPRKRRRQAYSQLIRGLLEKTRERLEVIRDVVKDEKQLRFHLRTDTNENNAEKMANVDDEVTIFEFTNPDATNDTPVRFTFDTVNDDASHISSNPMYTSSVPQKYFSSLLSAIGFNRIVNSFQPTNTPDAATEKQNLRENGSDSSISGNGIFATYLFNPVLDIWHSARKKFNFNLNERNGNAANVNDANDANDGNSDELQHTIVYADSNIANGGANGNEKNDEHNGKDNINQLTLFPLLSAKTSYIDDSSIQNVPSSNNSITKFNNKNNITLDGNVVVDGAHDDDDDDDIRNNGSRIHSNNKRNAPSSYIERAAQAFQNAFFKYSNYMPSNSLSKLNNVTTSTATHDANATNIVHKQVFVGPSNKSTSFVHNAIDINANGLLANFLDDTRSNIQIVPSGKSKINETTMPPIATTTTDDVSAATDVADKHLNPKRQSLESAGILVLEMFGTVIGLTWGAFSHVHSYFNNNSHNNETMT